jgi:predicted DNA-binding protein YlxM (UPF0122 family)
MMKNFERNAEIWRLYKENRMTLAAIGRMFNLSRQRVYQIVQAKKELVEHTKNWDKALCLDTLARPEPARQPL